MRQNIILGTIIPSVLTYDQLSAQLDEDQSVNPETSTYAPCDGRSIIGSCLANATQNAIRVTPDLRGKFMRGLNVMYSDEQSSPFDNERMGDPDNNRRVTSYQDDAFKQHDHGYLQFDDGKIYDMSNDKDQRLASYGNNQSSTTGKSGNATETRPRNIAVYYYIKIN